MIFDDDYLQYALHAAEVLDGYICPNRFGQLEIRSGSYDPKGDRLMLILRESMKTA